MARQPQRPRQRPGRQNNRGQNNNSGPAAASRSKAAIDRGLTADKVPGFDPGAAPLGTDDEAAGTPSIAVAEPPLPETARADPAGLAADPSGTDRRRYRMQDRMIWPVIAAVLAVIAIIVAIIFLM
jgi:hypothetical protein